jgi:hypothetical protein
VDIYEDQIKILTVLVISSLVGIEFCAPYLVTDIAAILFANRADFKISYVLA